EWESKRKEALAFYSYLNQDSLLNTNRRKFEITAQYVGQLQNIIGWLQKPETAPNRIQGAVDDGSLLQGSSMMMGAGIPMMGAGIPMMGAGVPMMGGMQGMGMPGMMGSMGMMGSSGNIGTLLSAAGSTSAANMALTQASARTLNGYGGMMGGYGYSAMGMQGGYGYSAMGMPMYPQMYGQQATPSASLPTVTQADVKAAAIEAARAQSQEDRLAAMQRDLDRERTERELDALRASRQNSQQSNPVATSVTVTSTKDSSSDDSVRTTPSRLEAAPDATLKGTADTTIDDPNSITDDQRRINGYIKFFKEQSKYLKDPARIGAFCDAAYEILSGAGKRSALGQKVWNTLTPEIINGLTITDRTRIREDMELHSVIFSKDGLLPDITKDDGTLIEPGIAVDILPLALKSALKLYKYIIDHESDLNITGDSTSQAKHIYNLFKHQQTDAIYFEKMSTVSLTDPNKLETFCLKALRILKRSKKTTMVWQKIKNTATLSSNDTDRTRFQEDVRLQKAIFSSNGLLIDLTLLKKLRYTAKGLDAAINLYQYILQNPSALGIDGDDVIQQQVTDLLNFFKQSQTTYKTSSPSIRASSTSRSVRTITVPLLETFTRPRKMVEAV
ncbi:MAG: hypothetical protein QG604_943, partial [Candidatus Dependentiae bacterium]|nr:hypothetical protein [Candidatus Dependentiae bacterium]